MIICLRSQNHQDLLPGNHFFSPCRIFTNILETSQAFIGRFFIQTWRARVWDRYHSLGQKEKQEMISFVLKSETKCRVFESFQPKWIFVSVHLATVGAFWLGQWGKGGSMFSDPKFPFPLLLVQDQTRRQETQIPAQAAVRLLESCGGGGSAGSL